MNGNRPYGFVQGLGSGAPDHQAQRQQPPLQHLTGYTPPNPPSAPSAHPETSQFQLQQRQQQLQYLQHLQDQKQLQYQGYQQHHLGLSPPSSQVMYHFGQTPPYGGALGVNPGLMQNTGGRAHMPADNGVGQGYQTPYTSSPYGLGVPSSTGPSMPQSYMSNAPSFAMMSHANMTAQQQHQQQQRMQPPVSTSIPSAQRVSPYGGGQQSTPPQAPALSQFMPLGNPTTNQPQQFQSQHQNTSQISPAQGQRTPQTPSFPTGPALQAPLSPASESREKERVSTLLDINYELLMEVVRLQQIQSEAKKEATTPTTTEGQAGGDGKLAEKPSAVQTGKDFVECMRRLQANLAYLAAIADRSHKPLSQIPPHPAIISGPPLIPYPKPSLTSSKVSSPIKKESTPPSEGINGAASATGSDILDQPDDRDERLLSLKQLYAHLQTLFPGADPKREPPIQKTSKGATPRPNPPPSSTGAQNSNPAAAAAMPPHLINQSASVWQGAMVGPPQHQTHAQAQMMSMAQAQAQAQNTSGSGPASR